MVIIFREKNRGQRGRKRDSVSHNLTDHYDPSSAIEQHVVNEKRSSIDEIHLDDLTPFDYLWVWATRLLRRLAAGKNTRSVIGLQLIIADWFGLWDFICFSLQCRWIPSGGEIPRRQRLLRSEQCRIDGCSKVGHALLSVSLFRFDSVGLLLVVVHRKHSKMRVNI